VTAGHRSNRSIALDDARPSALSTWRGLCLDPPEGTARRGPATPAARAHHRGFDGARSRCRALGSRWQWQAMGGNAEVRMNALHVWGTLESPPNTERTTFGAGEAVDLTVSSGAAAPVQGGIPRESAYSSTSPATRLARTSSACVEESGWAPCAMSVGRRPPATTLRRLVRRAGPPNEKALRRGQALALTLFTAHAIGETGR
jgi:hypothetical protein